MKLDCNSGNAHWSAQPQAIGYGAITISPAAMTRAMCQAGSLDARIASYELAAAMQTAAKEALDISQEPASIHKLYGIDNPPTRSYGSRCLVARRLVERGVRFVQLFLGGQPWDNHTNIRQTLPNICNHTDRPAAALVMDLKQRGLLEDTIVIWTTEFGRMPCSQGSLGRDHNPNAFTSWLAGGGIKGGITHGATDELGYNAVDDVVHVHDLHATMLHLLGVDHKRLTFKFQGRDFRLTDVHGNVVRPVLA